jgi:hypothetical protein
LFAVLRSVLRTLPVVTGRCRTRRTALGRCAEEQNRYYQLHVRRGKVALAAVYL